MPDEPNKMDEMLRSYAEQRRKESGSPGELHPVNRRMLQEEVSRVHGKLAAGKTGTTTPAWRGTIRRWLPVLAGFGGVAVFVALVIHQNPTVIPKQSQEMQDRFPPAKGEVSVDNKKAMDQLTDMASPAASTLATATPAPASAPAPVTLPALQPERRNLREKDAQLVRQRADSLALAAPKPLSSRDEVVKLGAAVAQDGAVKQLAKSVSKPDAFAAGQSSEPAMMKREMSGRLSAPTANAAPETRSFATATAVQSPVQAYPNALGGAGPENKQRYVRQEPQRRLNYNSPKAPPVLNFFEYSQNGNEVRIQDADGSIYLGSVVSDAKEQEAKLKESLDPGALRKLEESRSIVATKNQAIGAGQAAQNSLYFRASGTNLSMNEMVVFYGELVPETNAPGLDIRAQSKLDSVQNVQNNANNNSSYFNNSRIQGRAQIGSKQQVQINAVPGK